MIIPGDPSLSGRSLGLDHPAGPAGSGARRSRAARAASRRMSTGTTGRAMIWVWECVSDAPASRPLFLNIWTKRIPGAASASSTLFRYTRRIFRTRTDRYVGPLQAVFGRVDDDLVAAGARPRFEQAGSDLEAARPRTDGGELVGHDPDLPARPVGFVPGRRRAKSSGGVACSWPSQNGQAVGM